jgi:polyisoprenyl-teichoic acid--peptidoglycan teichoic acid transferase
MRTAPPRRWPRRVLIGLNIFLAICLFGVGTSYGYLKWRYGQINVAPDDVIGALDPRRDDPGSPVNVLLVGSDTRSVVSADETDQFGTSEQVGKPKSDTMMILHADPREEKAAILSIPRDLYVRIAGTNRQDRINTAFEDGPATLLRTIRAELGIEIDHYAQVDFNGFRGIVNDVGGVVVPFPAPARDRVSGLNVRTAGCVSLTGDQALAYVRSRHFQTFENGRWRTDPTGDLGRIQRQQDFIRRMIRRAIARGVRNPKVLNDLIGTGIDHVTIDKQFTTKDITKLATRFRSLEPDKVEMLTLPAVDAKVGLAQVLRLKQPEAKQVIDRFNGVTPPPAPKQAVPNIPTSVVRVRVLNGSGLSGQSSQVARSLSRAGFIVADTGNAQNFNFTTPVITYGSGQRPKALLLQAYIDGATPRLQEDRTLQGVDLVLTSGSQFSGIKPSIDAPSTPAPPPVAGPPTTTRTPRGAPVLNC